MRVIIAGSRTFNDWGFLEREVIRILRVLRREGYETSKENITIVSGRAHGADQLGERFAGTYGLKLKCFPADWDRFGKMAGYLRNEKMAEYAKEDHEIGVLIAFHDGASRGTQHMIDIAYKRKLKVFKVYFNKEEDGSKNDVDEEKA